VLFNSPAGALAGEMEANKALGTYAEHRHECDK
jgi:hypothetical protein